MSKYGLKAVSSFFINQARTNKKNELEKYLNDFSSVNTDWKIMFPIICNDLDIQNRTIIDKIHELIRSKRKRILLTGNAGIGKSTIMLRAAVEQARKGRNVYWLDLENINNTQKTYDKMIEYIHETSMPKIPSILFLENPYYGRDELLKLGRAFSGKTKNIQIVMCDRVQRMYELTYESNNYLCGWFEDVDIVIMHSQNEGMDNYQFLEYIFGSEYRIINMLPNKEWLKAVIVNFVKIKLKELPDNTINKILSKIDNIQVHSIVEIQYYLLFDFAELSKKIYAKNKLNCLLDWEEWANRLVSWDIVEAYDEFEYYQLMAVFGLFHIMTDLCNYIEFHSIQSKERKLNQKLHMMIGEYNIEPLKFQPDKNQIGPKHDIICELFFLFHQRWNKPFTIIFPYIKNMNQEQLTSLIEGIHLNIKKYSTPKYKNFNWSTMIEAIMDAPAYAAAGRKNRVRTQIVQCMFWAYINQGDFNKAYSYLKEQLYDEQYKNNVYLLNDYATLCTTLELKDEAVEVLEKVIKINSSYTTSVIALGKLYFYYKKDFSRSRSLFQSVLEINPKNSVARRYLGKILDEEKNFEDAEKEYDFVLRNDPSDYITLVEYGNHFLLISDRQRAIEKYRESLRVFPNNRDATVALGRVYLKQKDYEKAENYLKRALRLTKTDMDILPDLGELYIATGKQKDAVELYTKKGQVSNNSAIYLSEFANLYQRIGETRKAIQKHQEALQINPVSYKALSGLVDIYISQKKINLAEELLKDTFKKFPNYPHVLKLYIKLLEDTGQKNKISDILDNFINAEETYGKSYPELKHKELNIPKKFKNVEDAISLGELYINLGMYPEAFELYKNASECFKNNIEILWGLGQVYIAQKKDLEAVKILKSILEIQPDNYQVRAKLAQIYISKSNYEEADKVLFDESIARKKGNLTKIRKNQKSESIRFQKSEIKGEVLTRQNFIYMDDIAAEYNTTHVLEIVKEMAFTKEETIAFFNELIKRNPKNVQIINIFIEYYGKQKMYENAKKLFERALKIHDNHISIYISYGNLCMKLGNTNQAIEVYKEAIKYYPDSVVICVQLARLLESINRQEEAEMILLSSVKAGYSMQIVVQLLKLYYNLDKIKEADSLIGDYFEYHRSRVNELISIFQFAVSNKINIAAYHIEYIISNFELSNMQKQQIKKIFEKLYSGLKVMCLYKKITDYEENIRKQINLLYRYYKKILDMESLEVVWKYILDIVPEDNTTLLNLANLYIEQKGLDYAINFMESYYKDNNSAHIGLVYCNFLCKYGFTELAEGVLRQALIQLPESQELLAKYAKFCRMKGDIEQVKVIFSKLISINPENETYTHQLASVLVDENKLDEAKQVYLSFLQLCPKNENAAVKLYLIEIYLRQKLFELAYKLIYDLVEQKCQLNFSGRIDFKEFIRWSAENLDKEFMRKFAGWLRKNERIENLIYVYEVMLEKDDKEVSIYYNLGKTCDELCQYDKVIYYLEKGRTLLDLDRDNSAYYHRLASAYRKTSEYNKAFELYKAELSVKESFYGYSGMGLLHIWIGKLDKAEEYLLTAVKILAARPSPSVYLNFGILKLYQGNYPEAKKFFELSLNILSNHKKELNKVYYWMAKLSAKDGKEEEMMNYLRKIPDEKLVEIEDPYKEDFLSKIERESGK